MNTNLAYQEDWNDPLRRELIGGKLVMMSPAATNHVLITRNISYLFTDYLKGKPCTPIPDGITVFLTDEDHFVPDFMVVCDPEKVKSDGIHGAPDLVVEILSPGTAHNDRGRKMDVYAKCGVREYWIVSPGEKSVEQYLQDNGRLVLKAVYAIHPEPMLARMSEKERAAVVTAFQCSLFDDLIIQLADVFERVK